MSPSPSRLRILSRGSPLARAQVDEALGDLRACFPEAEFRVEVLETLGDRDLTTPLTAASVPTDFFTRELDRAQIEGDADLVVHSAKDLPHPLPDGLVVAAMLPARDTRDAWVVRAGVDLSHGGRVGTSSPLREKQIREIHPLLTCHPIRGNIQQRLAQLDAGAFDAVIIAACALQRLGLEERIHAFLDYETTPLQGRLAITVRADRHDLRRALRAIDVRRMAGLVAMVGCPADAALLCERGRLLIAEADIVLHDRLIPQAVLDGLGDRGEYVGKQGHSHSTTQAHIHRRILREAEKGKLVVRLHGGEPGILGHLGETLAFCEAWGLRAQVVPAVGSAQVAAALARTSLTHRHHGRSITFLSGHDPEHLPLRGFTETDAGNLAIHMGVRDVAVIRRRLLEAGWPGDTPVTIGQALGQPQEEILRVALRDLDRQALASPAVFLVGPEAHAGGDFTLFTGTDPNKFLRHGPLLHVPFIETVARPLEERVRILREGLAGWTGLVFPSSLAVDAVCEALMAEGDTRALFGKVLLAVGPLTARALADRGLRADASPAGFGGASALAAMARDLPPGRYAYLCSDQSPQAERQAAFAGSGIELCPLPFYETRPVQPESLPRLPFSRVLFTSGSTVRSYFGAFPREKTAGREWLAVGHSTLAAIETLGLPGHLLPGADESCVPAPAWP